MTTDVLASNHRRIEPLGIVFVLLGVLLGALMIAGSTRVYEVQGVIATLSDLLPVGYAVGAGMVAAVNPCGVLLLPSLVAYYLTRGGAAELSGPRRAGHALILAGMATLGFVTLFAIVGAVIGLGGRALAGVFPFGGLLVGVLLVGTGAWLALSGRALGILTASQAMGRVRLGDLRSLFGFGVAYAVCSLSCTLPIFLVVAGTALASGGILAATGQFIGYALGMGAMLTAVIVGAAFFQGGVSRWTRVLVPYVHRLSAAFLLGAGLFIIDYWLKASGIIV